MTAGERPDIEADVCVVGSGPTALFAAVLCARYGMSVALVSASAEFEPVGAGISPLVAPPTLALLAGNIENELAESGQRVLGVEDHGTTGLLSSWRYADYPAAARPHGMTVPTGTLTQALLGRLRVERRATVLTDEIVTAVDQRDEAVTLTTTRGRVQARYVAAADGRRSVLRGLIGVTVTESAFDRPAWLVSAPAVPGREPVLLVRHHAPRALFTIPTPRGSVAVVWSPDRSEEEALDQGGPAVLVEQLKAVDPELSAWLGESGTSPLMRLRFALWRAESWRVGRVLLLGESAHGFHTLGGQGLNQSLQSAASLARAIRDGRIEDYERIRRPQVERLQDVQWNVAALRSYSADRPQRGAHEDFIDVMTALPAELAAQLA